MVSNSVYLIYNNGDCHPTVFEDSDGKYPFLHNPYILHIFRGILEGYVPTPMTIPGSKDIVEFLFVQARKEFIV